MSPGPPSTAPSTRRPGPPYNDYAVRWWTVRAIWLGRPEPVLGDLGRHAIDPAWRRRHRTPAPGARLGRRLWRTGRPVVATVRSAQPRPRDGASLCVNAGKSGTGWLCAPTWSWPKGPPSTPAALTRCAPSQQRSQPGAQSAGQRRIASPRRAAGRSARCPPRAFAGPPCAFAPRVAGHTAPLPQAGWGVRPGEGERFGCAAFARAMSPGARASMWKGRDKTSVASPAAR